MSFEAVQPWEVFARDEHKAMTEGHWAFSAAMFLLQQPVDAAISLTLQAIGEAAGVDRAWMFEYDDELLRFRNTHEWSRQGTPCFVQDLQNAPVTMIGWLHQHLVAGKAVMINNVNALPRSAQALRVEMLRQGDRSVLSVPMFYAGRLRACIGFDAVRAPRRWSEAEVSGLFQCADLMAIARYRSDCVDVAEMRERFAPLVYLRKQGGVRGTPLAAIAGLRSSDDYTEVWLTDGSMILDQRPLIQWLAMTPRAEFLRIHRTAIVNLQHICDIGRRSSGAWQLRLQNLTDDWPVSRAGRAELRARLGI